MPAHALLNGEPAPDAPFRDRACQYGDGLFETFAVRDGEPCLWKYHMARLDRGCERLGIAAVDHDQLLAEARALCSRRERAVLKIIVSAGPSGRGYARPPEPASSRWVACGDELRRSMGDAGSGLTLQECGVRLGTQPLLAGIKHLNRLEQVLARRELRNGSDEGLLYDQSGHPVEGIMSNLLVLTGDRYLTPSLDKCGVAGTVRELVIEHAARLDRPLEVRPLQREEVYGAEALFMTNALMGIQPVARLGDHCFGRVVRPAALEALHHACFTFGGIPEWGG